MRSPLIWFGGKSKLAKDIIRLMPPHKVYIEPFGGAAHVIAQKPPLQKLRCYQQKGGSKNSG